MTKNVINIYLSARYEIFFLFYFIYEMISFNDIMNSISLYKRPLMQSAFHIVNALFDTKYYLSGKKKQMQNF